MEGVITQFLLCFLLDHGSPDPWGHTGQLGPGSYSGSAGSYSNSYGMHPRDSMVGYTVQLQSQVCWVDLVLLKFVYNEGFCLFIFRAMFVVFLFQH